MTDGDTRRSADCERANLLAEMALEETLDAQSREWLAAHRQVCPDCAAVAAAMERSGPIWSALDELAAPPEAPAMDVDRKILDHLNGAPVAALPIADRPRVLLAALALLVVALLPLMAGLRDDLANQPWTLIGLPVVLLVAAFLSVLLAFDHLDRRAFKVVAAAALAVVPITFLSTALLVEPVAGSEVPRSFVGAASSCGAIGVLVAAIVLLPLMIAARRGMAGPTRLGAILLGATTAALGAAVLQLHCDYVDVAHILVGHGVVFLLAPIAALLLRLSRGLG